MPNILDACSGQSPCRPSSFIAPSTGRLCRCNSGKDDCSSKATIDSFSCNRLALLCAWLCNCNCNNCSASLIQDANPRNPNTGRINKEIPGKNTSQRRGMARTEKAFPWLLTNRYSSDNRSHRQCRYNRMSHQPQQTFCAGA